jgi:hypothetical protein
VYIDESGHYYTIGARTGKNPDLWIFAQEGLKPYTYNLFENPNHGQVARQYIAATAVRINSCPTPARSLREVLVRLLQGAI